MKNNSAKILVMVIFIGLTSFKFGLFIDENSIVAPIYNKGTFWMIKYEKFTTKTSSGEVSVYTTNHSCYINKSMKFNDIEAYEMTFLKNDEGAVKVFIDSSNLSLIGMIDPRKNYNDTLSIYFELLNFPLFTGKKWESMSQLQESARRPILNYNVVYNVSSIRDTIFFIESEEIKTKAYKIRADFTRNNKKYHSEYVYLAPNKTFPGSCPLFLYWQFDKNSTLITENRNIKYEYTSFYKQPITNFNW